jgi:hypothetical protein
VQASKTNARSKQTLQRVNFVSARCLAAVRDNAVCDN